MEELERRLVRAAETLERMAGGSPEPSRLRAKAEGVRLALSYLHEAKREG